MKTLEIYLNCGRYYPKSQSEVGDFVVSKLLDITDKIIPFFEKYPILVRLVRSSKMSRF
jgi:lantibiotic modifying enzyme